MVTESQVIIAIQNLRLFIREQVHDHQQDDGPYIQIDCNRFILVDHKGSVLLGSSAPSDIKLIFNN